MRVYVTGAAGFTGLAVVDELITHGHQVLALVRTPEQAKKMKSMGAEPHMGDLHNLESLKSGAKAADGVIHLAFILDFEHFDQACATDRAAIDAMAEESGGKPFVLASGTFLSPKGALATEDTETEKDNPPFSFRALSSDLVYKLCETKNIRGSVIRISVIHGPNDKALIPRVVNGFKQNGTIMYVNDRPTCWPFVHLKDAASCFRLALEKGRQGATYHAVAEQGVAMKEVMTVAARRLGLEVKGAPLSEVAGVIGYLGHIMAFDNPVSSAKTQEELGWAPKGSTVLEDLETN